MKKYLYRDLFIVEDTHWWHISKRKIVNQLIKKYSIWKGPKVLDIGCGTGKNIEELQSLGNVYGLDSSPEALKFCKKRDLKNVTLGSAENTNLKSNTFDIITMLDVLEHTDDNKTLREANRILKKDGLIFITVPAYKWLWSKWDIVLHHQRRYTTKSLTRVVEKNNFTIKKISYMYSFLVLPALLTRMIKSLSFKKLYTSDFKLSSPLINLIMGKITNLESYWVKNLSVPFGTSIILVAQKTK